MCKLISQTSMMMFEKCNIGRKLVTLHFITINNICKHNLFSELLQVHLRLLLFKNTIADFESAIALSSVTVVTL